MSCPVGALASDADFEAALAAMRPRMWAFALRLTGSRHDAIDLVRRACVQAFERPEEFPTGFATPSAMDSLVHHIWLHQVRAARESDGAGRGGPQLAGATAHPRRPAWRHRASSW